MKWRRVVIPALMLMSGAALASAQPATAKAPVASAAQASFEHLKGMAGQWKGMAHVAVPAPDSFPVEVRVRVTSGGDALMHEMVPAGRGDDPANGADDPLTMFYLDAGRLMLTHYCDQGKNRPRMRARVSPDGKSVEFDFVDVAGETRLGHMHHALFTFIDADHHTEDWTYMAPDGASGRAHIVLTRGK